MAGAFQKSTSRYVDITDSSDLDLPVGGWTIHASIYPDSGLSAIGFHYIYSHGVPYSNAYALNILMNGTDQPSPGTVRAIFDIPSAAPWIDLQSSNTVVGDQWNTVIVVYDGNTLHMHLNGTTTSSALLASAGTIAPSGNARIGYSVAGGAREFTGRIAHVAKWNRDFSSSDAQIISSLRMTPKYAQQDLTWHVPLFTDQYHDEQDIIATSDNSLVWGEHSDTTYLSSDRTVHGSIPVSEEDYGYIAR